MATQLNGKAKNGSVKRARIEERNRKWNTGQILTRDIYCWLLYYNDQIYHFSVRHPQRLLMGVVRGINHHNRSMGINTAGIIGF